MQDPTLIAETTVTRGSRLPFPVHLRPTAAGQALLTSTHGPLEITATVTFKPRHGKPTSDTQTITIPAN